MARIEPLRLLLVIAALASVSSGRSETPAPCEAVAFATPPRVVLHAATLEGFGDLGTALLVEDMEAIHAQIGALAGTDVAIRDLRVSQAPWDGRSWRFDREPTIHVGFTSVETLAPPAGASAIAVGPGAVVTRLAPARCTLVEAHVILPGPEDADGHPLEPWALGEPEDHGEPYWDTAHADPRRGRYFRMAYLRALLHALGLDPDPTAYGMLNPGDRPWANRAPGRRLMPLPDDVRGLRERYPDPDDVGVDVAVLNTWVDLDALPASLPTAPQRPLCRPSAGVRFAGDFGETQVGDRCGADERGHAGERAVCPGDTLFTRYAVANYGTEDLALRARLWLSEDPIWNGAAADAESPDRKAFALAGGSSTKRNSTFEVPQGLAWDRAYHVLIRVEVENDVRHVAGAHTADWIPLRGTIRTKRRADCLDAAGPRPGVAAAAP